MVWKFYKKKFRSLNAKHFYTISPYNKQNQEKGQTFTKRKKINLLFDVICVYTLHIGTSYRNAYKHFDGFQCLMCYGWWILWDSVGQKRVNKNFQIFFFLIAESTYYIRWVWMCMRTVIKLGSWERRLLHYTKCCVCWRTFCLIDLYELNRTRVLVEQYPRQFIKFKLSVSFSISISVHNYSNHLNKQTSKCSFICDGQCIIRCDVRTFTIFFWEEKS